MSHHMTEVKDIHYVYPDGHKAINGISFRIHHGESVGIIGANGAGKSTLLMLLMGVLLPSQGEVRVGDILVTKETLPFIRQRMGMVFQNPDDQLFMTTVYDDVAFGPRNYKLAENEVEKRVQKALEMVGILHLKDRAPFKLSGGEKRAAAIASVLSMQPDILLMDEPFGALDALTRAALQDELIGVMEKTGATVVMVTHDVDEAVLLSDRVVMMTNGPAATIGEILAVDLPKPRDRLQLAHDARFAEHRAAILEFLYQKQMKRAA